MSKVNLPSEISDINMVTTRAYIAERKLVAKHSIKSIGNSV